MDKKKPSKDERGNVRYLWVLVGAYLLYLAYQQLQLVLQGQAAKTGELILCIVSGAVFAAVGAWVIYREWRAWRYAQTRKDDPETRGNASEEDNASADYDAPESEEVGRGESPGALELTEAESDEAEDAEESGEDDKESGDSNGEAESEGVENDDEEESAKG